MFLECGRPAVKQLARSCRYFSMGRRPVAATLVLIAGTLICMRWWYLNVPTNLLGQFHSRWIPAPEAVPIFSGVVAIALLSPRLPETDALGTRRVRLASTMMALGGALVAAGMMPLALLGLERLPLELVPGPTVVTEDNMSMWAALPLPVLWAYTLNAFIVLGASLALIASLGRHIGLPTSLLLYGGMIVVQSSAWGAWLPFAGEPGQPASSDAPQVATAIVTLCSGVVIWHQTKASAPLTRMLRKDA